MLKGDIELVSETKFRCSNGWILDVLDVLELDAFSFCANYFI